MKDRIINLFSSKFAKAITGALGLNMVEAGLGFATAIILTRLMGSANYGVYSYAIALVGVFTILGLLGQDGYIVKTVAKLASSKQFDEVSSFVKGAFGRTVLLNIVMLMTLIIALSFYQEQLAEDKYMTLFVAISIIFFTVLMRVYIGLFQGMQQVITSLYADKLIRPLSFFCIISIMSFFVQHEMSATNAITANALAAFIALAVIAYLWSQKKPYARSPSIKAQDLTTGWRPALPFALLAGVSVIYGNIDVIMLGAYVPDSEIGIYRIAGRVATLISFAIIAVRSAFNPRISSLYAQNDFATLQNIASKAALATTVVALPCFLVFVFAGYWVLILFGDEFTSGTNILTVLSIGQLIGTICASGISILMMTSHANKAAQSLIFGAILNVVLNYLLIPSYGAIGAAYATTTALTAVNIVNTYFVWTYLKINPTVFGFIFRKY
jgi:O-antigen/teichoic acid export membrane protein